MDKDNELLSRLKGGDEKAYNELFHQLYGRLCSFAGRYVKDQEVAEEIVEEAMVVLWEKRDKFETLGALKSYLYTTVRNASLDFLKKSGRHVSMDLLEGLESLATADNFIIEEEVHGILYDAIASLPEKCRRVFELSCIEELKYSEIADDMGISLNTVKSQRARALQLLREILKNYPYYVVISLLLTK
ncbi:RNA polymerase sigma factor [uncultured Pontibacter sp.]|uniref:RNA polymerase sigma factor n=1 Tax=uncultured Pontibacter sp. TaxID=453356 RepID=UPI00260FB09B|nr:RNA polymerase sigma-70 factor [uncultured Pontibacter sp.]